MLLGRLMHRMTKTRNRERDGEGTVKLGRYELLHPLGVGGMAEVFKARALGPAGFERNVVIKRILPAHGRDPEFIRMFVDEAKILGMLHHPNVVQAYDFGDDDGVLFLALEYVDGPSLSRTLRTLRSANRKMPPAIAAYIARDVCRALDYVHNLADGQGAPLDIIHRDVTPSNIVLTATGGVKLLDFGVATFSRAVQITKSGTVKGKPAYLAPEQLEGKEIDGRVDLFALGIVMHEMLSLQHLFAGDSDLGTVKKIMEMKIPSPAAERDDVPPALEEIVMRALERDRDRRFGSAAEMARALDDFVVASRLHMDEVAAFVREIEEMSQVRRPASSRPVVAPAAVVRRVKPRSPWPHDGATSDEAAPTRREGRLMSRIRTTGRVIAARPKTAVAIGLMLAVLGLGTAFGLRVTVTAQPNSAAAAPVVVEPVRMPR